LLNTKGGDEEEAEWVRDNAEQEGGGGEREREGGEGARGGGCADPDSRINTLMAVSQFLREIWTSNLACSAAAAAAAPTPPPDRDASPSSGECSGTCRASAEGKYGLVAAFVRGLLLAKEEVALHLCCLCVAAAVFLRLQHSLRSKPGPRRGVLCAFKLDL
jgi:hypothetical protein